MTATSTAATEASNVALILNISSPLPLVVVTLRPPKPSPEELAAAVPAPNGAYDTAVPPGGSAGAEAGSVRLTPAISQQTCGIGQKGQLAAGTLDESAGAGSETTHARRGFLRQENLGLLRPGEPHIANQGHDQLALSARYTIWPIGRCGGLVMELNDWSPGADPAEALV